MRTAAIGRTGRCLAHSVQLHDCAVHRLIRSSACSLLPLHRACRYLYGVLVKEPVISPSNKARIVEVLRSIAELIIWGDQHSPAFFDFFAGQGGESGKQGRGAAPATDQTHPG